MPTFVMDPDGTGAALPLDYGEGHENGLEGVDGEDNVQAQAINDYAAEEYGFQDRLRYFLRGNRIETSSRRAAEAVCLIQAYGHVVEQEKMQASQLHILMYSTYHGIIGGLPEDLFVSSVLKERMMVRLHSGQRDYDGKSLWRRAKDVVQVIRRDYLNTLPGNLKDLESGISLKEKYDEFVLNAYKRAHPEVEENLTDAEIEVPSEFYLVHNKLEMLLSVMVHRRGKEIHDDPASAPPGSTRKEQRESAQERLEVARVQERARQGTEDANDYLNRSMKKARLFAAHAMARKESVDAIANTVRLLNENRAAYVAIEGEVSFNRRILRLLKGLPIHNRPESSDEDDNEEIDNNDVEVNGGEAAVAAAAGNNPSAEV